MLLLLKLNQNIVKILPLTSEVQIISLFPLSYVSFLVLFLLLDLKLWSSVAQSYETSPWTDKSVLPKMLTRQCFILHLEQVENYLKLKVEFLDPATFDCTNDSNHYFYLLLTVTPRCFYVSVLESIYLNSFLYVIISFV